MEILYTIFNMIASLITEVLYDKSLVNNLFSFDLNKKYVVFKSNKFKIKRNNEDNGIKDLKKENDLILIMSYLIIKKIIMKNIIHILKI